MARNEFTVDDDGRVTEVKSSIKHTPGPWKVCDMGVVIISTGSILDSIAETYRFAAGSDKLSKDPDWVMRQEANAHLIAAAPELLDALKYALHTLEDYCKSRGDDWEDTDEPDCEVQAYRMVKAAIAKAEGRGQ